MASGGGEGNRVRRYSVLRDFKKMAKPHETTFGRLSHEAFNEICSLVAANHWKNDQHKQAKSIMDQKKQIRNGKMGD